MWVVWVGWELRLRLWEGNWGMNQEITDLKPIQFTNPLLAGLPVVQCPRTCHTKVYETYIPRISGE